MKKILIIIAIATLFSVAVWAAGSYTIDPEPPRDYRQPVTISQTYRSPFNIDNRIYSNQGNPSTAGVTRLTTFDPRSTRVGYLGEIDRFVYLYPIDEQRFAGAGRGGYAPFYERGTAKIDSRTWFKGKHPSARVTINTKDLPPSDRVKGFYEGWMVDDDTGHRHYLGAFTTTFGGIGELKYSARTYFDAYERVEVTFKEFGDPMFGPGELVLSGQLPLLRPQPEYYNPPSKSGLLLTEALRKY